MILNCGAGEATWEFLDCKEIKAVIPKGNRPWIFIGRTDHLIQRADSLEKTLILGKTEGKGEDSRRGWDGYIASPTHWTWIWANSQR